MSKGVDPGDSHTDELNFEEDVEENLHKAVRKQREPRSMVTGSVDDILCTRYNGHTMLDGEPRKPQLQGCAGGRQTSSHGSLNHRATKNSILVLKIHERS